MKNNFFALVAISLFSVSTFAQFFYDFDSQQTFRNQFGAFKGVNISFDTFKDGVSWLCETQDVLKPGDSDFSKEVKWFYYEAADLQFTFHKTSFADGYVTGETPYGNYLWELYKDGLASTVESQNTRHLFVARPTNDGNLVIEHSMNHTPMGSLPASLVTEWGPDKEFWGVVKYYSCYTEQQVTDMVKISKISFSLLEEAKTRSVTYKAALKVIEDYAETKGKTLEDLISSSGADNQTKTFKELRESYTQWLNQ